MSNIYLVSVYDDLDYAMRDEKAKAFSIKELAESYMDANSHMILNLHELELDAPFVKPEIVTVYLSTSKNGVWKDQTYEDVAPHEVERSYVFNSVDVQAESLISFDDAHAKGLKVLTEHITKLQVLERGLSAT